MPPMKYSACRFGLKDCEYVCRTMLQLKAHSAVHTEERPVMYVYPN